MRGARATAVLSMLVSLVVAGAILSELRLAPDPGHSPMPPVEPEKSTRPAPGDPEEDPQAPSSPNLSAIALPPPPQSSPVKVEQEKPAATAAKQSTPASPPENPVSERPNLEPLRIAPSPDPVRRNLQPSRPRPNSNTARLKIVPLKPAAPAKRAPPVSEHAVLQPAPSVEIQPSPAEGRAALPPQKITPEAKEEPNPRDRQTIPRLPTAKTAAEGRVLLRILEHGAGPTIEIAWPDNPSSRRRLYGRLVACYGMRLALMDTEGKLFEPAGAPGSAWEINLDRYSGFVREPAGQSSREEQRQTRRIRNYHGGLRDAASVRVFPRRVDALLLGGLRQIIGEAYEGTGSIRASYNLAGRRLWVQHIWADGHSIPGRIDLSPAIISC